MSGVCATSSRFGCLRLRGWFPGDGDDQKAKVNQADSRDWLNRALCFACERGCAGYFCYPFKNQGYILRFPKVASTGKGVSQLNGTVSLSACTTSADRFPNMCYTVFRTGTLL